MKTLRPFLVTLFLSLAGLVQASEWRALHSEHGGNVSSRQPIENGTAFNFSLPHNNASLVLGYAVNFPLVIEDLEPTLRLQSDQPGLAIGAQVVLPRVLHPETQRPITYIVPGMRYIGSGNWETLGFRDRTGTPNLQRESNRIAALLQSELRMPFDMRGQYVRQIILYAEQLPQHSADRQVHISAPNVQGYIAAPVDSDVNDAERELLFDPMNYAGFKVAVSAKPMYLGSNQVEGTEWDSPLQSHTGMPLVASPRSTAASRPAMRSTYPDGNYMLTSQTFSQSSAALTHIQFNDGVLYLDDVPIGVRAIQYQGEPLEFLRSLQFNAVWITEEQQSLELRLEAQRAGIWLICPPPSSTELESVRVYNPNAPLGQSGPSVDSSYDNVLIWNLGDEGSHARYSADAQRAHVLQTADRLKRRPILATARSGVYDYSRTADILMMSREPLFSSLDMLDVLTWQREYPSLARPSTAFWCKVQTQIPQRLAVQWTMFEGNPPFINAVSYAQIKSQIYIALASGSRGILFTSHTPLNNADPETEFRRTALELANWELQLVDDWFAAGTALGTMARSNQSRMSSAVIQSGRSRLLVPIWQERHNQSVIGPAVVGPARYIVSGIPETYDAYHLVPGRVLPMRTQRVAGGVQIELDEASLNSLIFFGEGDAINARVGQRATQMGARTAYLAYRLAELELAMAEQVLTTLKQAKDTNQIPIHPKDNLPLISMPEHESMLRATRDALELAKSLANRTPPDFAQSYLQSERASRGLRFVGRSLWQDATRHDLNLCMTPVSVSFATLPLYLTAYHRTNGAQLTANRLRGGDMEMRTLEQAGWEVMSHKVEGAFVAKREISPAAAHSGQSGLWLAVAPEIPADRPRKLETIPLWVATPPIPVNMGEMICVHGKIRIPNPIQSTVDGLMIFDSLGGEELTLRFIDTAGEWREFAFYRIVPEEGNYYVFFALNGFGEVHLDDIGVASVQFSEPMPVRPSESQQQQAAPYWRRLMVNPLQYLPPIPNWGQ